MAITTSANASSMSFTTAGTSTVSIGSNTLHVVSHGAFPNVTGVYHDETGCLNMQTFMEGVVSKTNDILTAIDTSAPEVVDDSGQTWRSRESSYYNSFGSNIYTNMGMDVEHDPSADTLSFVARLEINIGGGSNSSTITRVARVATVYHDKTYPLPKRMEALARLHNFNTPKVHFTGTSEDIATKLLDGLGEAVRDKLNTLAAIQQRMTSIDNNYHTLLSEQQRYYNDIRNAQSNMGDSLSQLLSSSGKWDSV